MMTRNGQRTLPPTYLFVALAVMVGCHYVVPHTRLIPFPWVVAGCVPLGIGLVVACVTSEALKKAGTTVKPFEESTALITTGVFTASRNPMYVGFVLMLAGVAVILGSTTPFCVVPTFAVVMDVVFVAPEERMLASRFGEAWTTYAARTRRWI